MKVLILTFNSFGVNTYIIYDPETKQCAIIDPGMMDAREREALDRTIDKYGLHPVHLINTHMHVDHVLGNKYVTEEYGTGVEAHKNDEKLGKIASAQAAMLGMAADPGEQVISTYLNDGDVIEIGHGHLKVISVPGHSRGGIALYDQADGLVFTGDSLFRGSIGRTDFPEGNHQDLLNSVRSGLFTLPDSTTVFPGHGPASTIGDEKATNPFF